ncbi:MAG: hypothetical protein ACKOHN_02970 [Actinomycetota bacterium]
MGLLGMYLAYRHGRRARRRDDTRDERLRRRQAADRCFRCGKPYVEHVRANFYRCP